MTRYGQNKIKIRVVLFGISALLLLPTLANVASLTLVSDTISTSALGANANHTIQFTATNAVPVSGKIVITPQSGNFTIPAALDFSDIDLLVGGTNRSLSSSPGSGSGSAIGVSVTSGTSGNITLTLNDSDTITAGSAVIVKIGTQASFGATGVRQIQNPSVAGSYKISLATKSSSDAAIDQADAMVAIVSPVSVAAEREAPAAPAAAPPPPSQPSGGGSPSQERNRVICSGRAYSGAKITILKDAQIASQTFADSIANFRVIISELFMANYIFGVYAEDVQGRRSVLWTSPISVTSGAPKEICGIFIAPTIAVDKSEAKRGDDIAIFGYSAPRADITIFIDSQTEFFAKTIADKDGFYTYNLDTSALEHGVHYVKSRAAIGGSEVSSWSYSIDFKVGAKTILEKLPIKIGVEIKKGDFSGDNRVNLVDFSIAAYWYKRPSPPASIDLNGDKKIDLIDFSIMAFYWTG